jgi:menaquinol-cytochrome c reductase cytochrome b/c subunit
MMAQGNHSNEKVIYVGDSRVPQRTNEFIPRDYSAYPGKSETFIPNFLLKEWIVATVFMVGFLLLIINEPAPLGETPANPANTDFIPMPDWYFLFLYQLLKYPYTAETYVVFGTVILPGLLFGALTLAPFLDRGEERRFYQRPISSLLMGISLAAVVYLTYVSWTHYQDELAKKNPEGVVEEKAGKKEKKPKKAAAVALVDEDNPANKDVYQKSTCVACHGTDLKGGPAAPTLRGIGSKYSKEDILGIIKNGQGSMGAQYDANIAMGLTDENINALAEWLGKQKSE